MTVIAYKDGEIAADTAVWHGNVITGYTPKIERLRDIGIFAGAGWLPEIAKARDWIISGMPRNNKPSTTAEESDLDCILLVENGSLLIITHKFEVYTNPNDMVVCGSHPEFLYGAMASGASASQAVEAAIRYCAMAAGEVQSVRL